MNNQESMDFLLWLYQRLKVKYNEDECILLKLDDIIKNKKIVNQKIHPQFIQDICEKNYPGFFMEKSTDIDMGYSPQERSDIRSFVSSIIIDTLNDNKY